MYGFLVSCFLVLITLGVILLVKKMFRNCCEDCEFSLVVIPVYGKNEKLESIVRGYINRFGYDKDTVWQIVLLMIDADSETEKLCLKLQDVNNMVISLKPSELSEYFLSMYKN